MLREAAPLLLPAVHEYSPGASPDTVRMLAYRELRPSIKTCAVLLSGAPSCDHVRVVGGVRVVRHVTVKVGG